MRDMVEMPFDYNVKETNLSEFQLQNRAKKLFDKYHLPKEKEALDNYPIEKESAYNGFKDRLEVYYGEVHQIIEGADILDLKDALSRKDQPMGMFEVLDIPLMDYRRAKKII